MSVLVAMQQAASVVAMASQNNKRKKTDHRALPREEKKDYQHQRALDCIMYDYLGPKPLFDGREFDTMFRVSRRRFQCLMEDIGNSGIPFIQVNQMPLETREPALKQGSFSLSNAWHTESHLIVSGTISLCPGL